jgi:hypothetical protein
MITAQEKIIAKKKTARARKDTPQAHSRASHQNALVHAEGGQCFWCSDGQVLASLIDLKHALSRMGKETYGYHVQSDKNDFAVWVEYVLFDKKCADALRKAKTQKSAVSCVEKRLSAYTL